MTTEVETGLFDYFYGQINKVYEGILSVPVISILHEHATAISISLYLIWYIKAYLSRTELVCKDGSLMHKMIDKFTSVHSGYRPTIWCFPAALNTIVFALIQRVIKHNYEREILKAPDGGLFAIDWINTNGPQKVVLLVLPGLTGSSKENYVSHFVEKAVKMGCPAVVMNYRGIEVELKTPRTYCATNYEDLHLVVTHIAEKYKGHKILAVGISLGGIKLGGYLAKQYDDCLVSNALIVSAPMNVFYSCEESISLRDFDTKFVSKQFGYNSCEDYYRDACLDAKIQNIKTPTIFLNAGDDMFSPERAFPIDKIKQNPYTAMVWTKYGGHISFCEGLVPTGCNYACRLLTEYLQHVLNEI